MTLDEMLKDAGFNWEDTSSVLLLGKFDDYGDPADGPFTIAKSDDPRLFRVFDGGYGAAECIPFHAQDSRRIYFLHEYDGSEHVAWELRDIMEYLK